jgi:hypothetical protein
MMRRRAFLLLGSPILIALAWGCGRPSAAAVESTREAVRKVESPEAWEYAPDQVTAAEEALTAAEEELAVQRRRLPPFRSYEKATLLLESAREKAARVPAAITAGKKAAGRDAPGSIRREPTDN